MSLNAKVSEILGGHNLMHIATVDGNGMPYVRGVDFVVGRENILYFVTDSRSRKVEHIKKNSDVAIAVDSDCPDMKTLSVVKYLNATAKASIVDDPAEAQAALGMLVEKFPFFTELPHNPSDVVCIRVSLKEVVVCDNTVSFGHSEKISYPDNL